MTKPNDDLSALATRVAQRQASWLQAQFSAAAVDRTAPDRLTLRLPALFNAEVLYSLSPSGRYEGRLYPVEVSARTLEDAVGILYERVMEGFTTPRGRPMELLEYVPQPNQAFELDHTYEFIQHHDPEHDHSSPRLINLLPIEIWTGGFMGSRRVVKGSLDTGNHCHLLIP